MKYNNNNNNNNNNSNNNNNNNNSNSIVTYCKIMKTNYTINTFIRSILGVAIICKYFDYVC